jgi:hypothetical protein
MIRTIGTYVGVFLLMGAGQAVAQEVAPGPGTLEVTVIPAGGTYFRSKGSNPDFGNYTYGGALAYNINRIVGVEGEASGSWHRSGSYVRRSDAELEDAKHSQLLRESRAVG